MIVVKNLTKVYKSNRKSVVALDNVSFTLPDTGMIFIVGKSGSGKSTLLNMLSGLDSFTSGKILAGRNSLGKMTPEEKEKYLGSYIGYIFQDYRLIEDFTVRQNIELAADISDSGAQYEKYLYDVGLEGYEDRYPKELSGGQKQRVAIARALIKKPKVVLADEPTGNLDKTTTKEILRLLKSISKDTLVVLVSHNLRDADEFADRIIELSDGAVVKDESRVPGYKNRFSYKDGYINLPHHKDLEPKEIGEMLRRAKYAKGIIQNTSGFVPTEEEGGKGRRTRLHNKGMSLSNLAKMFSIFFKRKLLSKITTVFLAAVILSVFYVIQALTLYNTNTAILNTLVNSGSNAVIVQTANSEASTGKIVGHLSESDIEKIDEAYDGNIYRLYTEYLYTTPKTSGESTLTSQRNVLGFYSLMTVGTLNTTEQYAARLLGVDKIEVLAGKLYDKEYGQVITDYTADSIIANSLGKYKSYEDLIGEYKVSNKVSYINAVINTNYEEEHSEIRNELLSLTVDSSVADLANDERLINLLADVSERYGITYNFSENYEEALREYHSQRSVMRISAFLIKGKKSSTQREMLVRTETGKYTYGLGDGEIAMSVSLYNTFFKTNLTAEDAESFTPTKVTIAQYENSVNKTVFNRKELTIVKLIPNGSYFFVNENTYDDLFEYNTYAYSVYLDDPAMATEAVEVVEREGLQVFTGRVGSVYFIERCIEVFGKFFDITMVIILAACVFFLVNFGIKSIRSNIYEIGVIKAMGGIRRDISKIFISQSLVMGIGILIVTYFGMDIGAYIANDIFMTALGAVTPGNLYGIRAIDFYPDVALYDIGIALAVVVISAIISTRSIDKLNLISILKAKE